MNRSSRLFYGWVIVAVGFLILALAYGVRYSFAVIFPSLLDQFQWSRDTTALMLSIHLLAYAITSPIAGAMTDSFGARKTMATGAVLLAAGAAISARANALWHFYLSFGVLMGIGLCLMGSVPLTRITANWFVRKRGLALSLMFFGSGGAHVLYPLIAFLIVTVGWRGAFLVEAAMVAAFLLPLVAFLVRYHPSEKGLFPDGRANPAAGAVVVEKPYETIVDEAWASVDWNLKKAVRTSRFWFICLCAFAIWGFTEHIMIAHHVAFAVDVGYSQTYAAAVLALFGILMSVGSLAGMVSDRIGREATYAIATVIGVSGIVVLMLIKDTSHPWMLYLYAVLFGLGFGLTSPTLAASATDLFQGKRAGAVIGFVWFSFGIGGTIAPWLGGKIFEVTGSYFSAFLLSIVAFILSCILLWLAAPRRVRLVAGRGKRPG